jgi:tetratricopeptide (TPR) repeat protein
VRFCVTTAAVIWGLAAGCATSPDLGSARRAEESGRHGAAIDLYRAAIDQPGDSSEAEDGLARALYQRARIRHAADHNEDAIADLDRVIALRPGQVDAHVLRAALLTDAGHPPGSIATDLEAAVVERPSNVRLRIVLANVYKALGDKPTELAHLLRATRIAPRAPAIRVALADALATSGHPKRAEAELQRALELHVDHEGALVALAADPLGGRRAPDALRLLQRAKEAHPKSADVAAKLRAFLERQRTGRPRDPGPR